MPKPEKLDVENDEARQKRLQALLEGLSTIDDSADALNAGVRRFEFGEKVEGFEPNVELLSRVQAFLPQLEASNRELLERARVDPRSVDIECVEEGGKGKAYIEMNLGLGVFEQKRKAKAKADARSARKAAAAATKLEEAGEGEASSEDDDSGDSSASSDDSDDSDEEDSEDEDSDGEGNGDEDEEDPLTSFFNSLRHGQTVSMDSSDSDHDSSEEGSESESEGEGDEDDGAGEGAGKRGERGERKVKPLPKRARPTIEVIASSDEVGGDPKAS